MIKERLDSTVRMYCSWKFVLYFTIIIFFHCAHVHQKWMNIPLNVFQNSIISANSLIILLTYQHFLLKDDAQFEQACI